MALYTFTNAASDGDLDNVSNWDLGALPGAGDTAALDSQTVGTGTLAAAVVSAVGTTINGGTFSNGFYAYSVTINGGTFSGSINFGAGTTLNVDPGAPYSVSGTNFASGTFSSLITDTGGSSYQAGCIFNVTFVLGQGSTIYGGAFNYVISTVTAGTYPAVLDGMFAGGSTFTACYIEGGTFPDSVHFHSCSISGGTFGTSNVGVTVTGISSITGGAWTQLTVNSDVQFVGSPTFSDSLTIHFIRGPYIYNAYISNATISIPDPGYPAQDDVLSGTGVGNIGDGSGPLYSGTLTLPSAGNVLAGVTYGIGGNGSTGTYAAGSLPSASDVRNGVSVGSGTGTLVVPAAANVLSGITFDNGTSGTLVLPSTANVLLGTAYGIGGAGSTGTLNMAATRLGSGLIRRR